MVCRSLIPNHKNSILSYGNTSLSGTCNVSTNYIIGINDVPIGIETTYTFTTNDDAELPITDNIDVRGTTIDIDKCYATYTIKDDDGALKQTTINIKTYESI